MEAKTTLEKLNNLHEQVLSLWLNTEALVSDALRTDIDDTRFLTVIRYLAETVGEAHQYYGSLSWCEQAYAQRWGSTDPLNGQDASYHEYALHAAAGVVTQLQLHDFGDAPKNVCSGADLPRSIDKDDIARVCYDNIETFSDFDEVTTRLKVECATAKNAMQSQMAVANVGIPLSHALGESLPIKLVEDHETNSEVLIAKPKTTWQYVHLRLDIESANKSLDQWDTESRAKFVERYNQEFGERDWFRRLTLSAFGQILRDRAKRDRKKAPE